MNLNTSLPRAWKLFVSNKRYLLIAVLLEFVFLFALAQLHFAFFVPSADAATRAGDAMSRVMEDLPEGEIYTLEASLVNDKEFMSAYKDLLNSIVFFFLGILAAWCIFKAPVWYLSHKSANRKVPLKLMLKFALVSLFWFAIMLAVMAIYSITSGSAETILPLTSPAFATIIVLLLFAAILYFAQVSFALLPLQKTIRNSFVLGVKNAGAIFPAFIVNLIIVFIVLTLPFNWIETLPLLSLAIILLIAIPSLAFTRLHLITTVWLKKQ